MTLGSVHSGFSITEGKARMETNETFETLFPRILPSFTPRGEFAALLRWSGSVSDLVRFNDLPWGQMVPHSPPLCPSSERRGISRLDSGGAWGSEWSGDVT